MVEKDNAPKVSDHVISFAQGPLLMSIVPRLSEQNSIEPSWSNVGPASPSGEK